MPTISTFFGIVVYMYFFDTKQHRVPHIHVEYQDAEASISIETGRILAGHFPKTQLKLVQAWLVIHQTELLKAWTLAAKGEPIFKIEPLK